MRCMGKFSSAKIIMMLFQCTIHPIFILLSMWQDYVHFLYFFALKILSFLHIKNRHIWYIFLKLDFFLWNQKYNVLYCIVYCKHRTKYANENKNETTNIKNVHSINTQKFLRSPNNTKMYEGTYCILCFVA